MANNALAVLESALRARKLDRTLTTALAPLDRVDAAATAASTIDPLDAVLRGGLPRGQLSEIAGPRSSGRTTVVMRMMAAATGREEIAAVIDTFDRFDVASAAAAGIHLARLLWVRGESQTLAASVLERTIDRALKSLNLVLQAGGFGIVALDLADAPLPALTRIPFTTWLRVQRTIEGSDTACVLLVPQPLARSAGGVTLTLGTQAARWIGASARSRRFAGLDVDVRVVSPRRRVDGQAAFAAAINE